MAIMMKCGCASSAVCKSSGGVTFDPPIPSCPVHDCIEPADTAPSLIGRQARCCAHAAIVPSSPDLPFFEFLGEGSRDATEVCACGFHRIAHTPEKQRGNRHICQTFTPRGAAEFDRYYCGHGGWD